MMKSADLQTMMKRVTTEISHLKAANDCLRLELSAKTLLRLLASGELCAVHFRCLDYESKQRVRRLLLMSIEKIWNTENACNGRCNECRRSKDKAKKALEIYVKGPDKNASSILDVTDAQPDIFNDLV